MPVEVAGTSDAGAAAAPETAPAPDGASDESGQDGRDGRDGADGADGQDGQPGEDGQPGQAGGDVVVVDSASDGGDGGKRRDNDGRDRKEKDKDNVKSGRDAHGNGGVSDVVADPQYFNQQLDLEQQDGTDATAGATGENGTVNGVPRETPESAAATTGPGNPLLPGAVILPPSVPGLPDAPPVDGQVTSPGIDPGLTGGVGGTTELAFDVVADTTVFTAAPDSPQTPESAGLLALGGPQGATSLLSFDVSGVGDGTVLAARLTFIGAGEAGAAGGGVGVIYDYITADGISANSVPGADTALNVQGAPAWFERVEPGAVGAVDVSGSVFGDGAVTFVLTGQPEETALIYAIESGAPAQLTLTVAVPA